LKKTIISLLLVITFILSMSENVFAVDNPCPYVMARDTVEQAVSK